MNWFLINNYYFLFFKFYSCNNNFVLFNDIKGGKDIIFLIDWIYDNVKYVIFVGVCLFLMSLGI